jgi:hypothetical protein
MLLYRGDRKPKQGFKKLDKIERRATEGCGFLKKNDSKFEGIVEVDE